MLVRAMSGFSAPNSVKYGTKQGNGAPEPEESNNPYVSR